MNQLELEQMMVDGGRARAVAHLRNNEESGRGYDNPYAQAVYRRFVEPMAEVIGAYLGEVKRGVQAAAKGLLREHDPLVLSFITIRAILGSSQEERLTLVKLAENIGRTVYGETILAKFEEINPELYYTLVHDFERRMTKSERHRLRVFKMSADKAGVELPFWASTDVVGVGTLLVSIAREIGAVDMSEVRHRGKKQYLVSMSPEVVGIVQQVTNFVVGAMPNVLPCVEPPRPWVTASDGGYHSTAMRCNAPCVVRGRPFVEREDDVPPMVLRAVNRLQRDVWEVNGDILRIVDEVKDHFDVGEVLSQAEFPKPDKPEWLAEDMRREDMTDEQLQDFARWRSEVREWHTTTRSRGRQWGRFYEALRVARLLQDQEIYFVWQMDYRGRFYAMGRGINPQGSDLQKALIRARNGAELTGNPEAIRAFKIAGAGRFGYDKATMDERVQWVNDRHALILACATDPINNRQWTEADSPFQFLAWCLEYAGLVEAELAGRTFLTKLPLGQDGSCNGLQHYSAMLRDEIGGEATNLVPGPTQQDLYGRVAEATIAVVKADTSADEGLIGHRWRLHPIARGMVKRSVMTLPYGATRFSCADFILKEYLQPRHAPEFAREEYSRASNWISYRVWKAIGQVVVKAREAMEWLQDACDELTVAGIREVAWRSPSGFRVRQYYAKIDVVQIVTRLVGGARIRPSVAVATDEVDKKRHKNGIAPNFVHSCDAAHMHFLINAAEDAGLGHLAFIHDDYGALAPDVPKLHELIRQTFVDMYVEHDPLKDFADTFGIQKELPTKGTLDIQQVKDSVYFFG